MSPTQKQSSLEPRSVKSDFLSVYATARESLHPNRERVEQLFRLSEELTGTILPATPRTRSRRQSTRGDGNSTNPAPMHSVIARPTSMNLCRFMASSSKALAFLPACHRVFALACALVAVNPAPAQETKPTQARPGLKIVKTEFRRYGGSAGFGSYSPDLKHYAGIYWTPDTKRQFESVYVEVDGIQHKSYEFISSSLNYNKESSVLAYWAKDGKRFVPVVNGREQGAWDQIDQVQLSETGTNWGFRGLKGGKSYVVVNGAEYAETDPIGLWTWNGFDEKIYFAKAGANWGAFIKKDGMYQAVINGEVQPTRYNSIGDNRDFFTLDTSLSSSVGLSLIEHSPAPNSILFSADGKSHAYAGKRGGKWFVVKDGREWGPYEKLGADKTRCSLALSPNGAMLAYFAKVSEQDVLFTNGVAGPEFKKIFEPLRYSPTSGTMAFRALNKANKQVVVWGERVIDLGEEKYSIDLIGGKMPYRCYFLLSPDGRSLYFNTIRGLHISLWHDGIKKEYRRCEIKAVFQLENPFRVITLLHGKDGDFVVENGQESQTNWVVNVEISPDKTYYTTTTKSSKRAEFCYPGKRYFDYKSLLDYQASSKGRSVLLEHQALSKDGSAFALVGARNGNIYLNVSGVESEPFDLVPYQPLLFIDSTVVRVILEQGGQRYRVESPLK